MPFGSKASDERRRKKRLSRGAEIEKFVEEQLESQRPEIERQIGAGTLDMETMTRRAMRADIYRLGARLAGERAESIIANCERILSGREPIDLTRRASVPHGWLRGRSPLRRAASPPRRPRHPREEWEEGEE
jgi:hypothetical protein